MADDLLSPRHMSTLGESPKDRTVAGAVPSPDNPMKYFIDVQQWARGEGVKLSYFSSFDEPWKLGQEEQVGTQWGLWDKDERAKYGG